MSEIEKLMQNAGIKKAPDINNCYPEMMKCHHCEHYKVIDEYTGRCLNEVYPEFTAEKQLELIKWLAITRAILIKQNRIFVGFETGNPKDLKCVEDLDLNFEETLAKLINNLWQDLSDTEKAEIKEILK